MDGAWPRKIWFLQKQDNTTHYFEARLSNKELGEYHGYPITEEECPKTIKQLFHV
jgi:hypothetical protein